MNNTKIVEIEIEKLFEHPKNPRLDVGDVTELAESIKAQGILQNLTVVKGGAGVPEGVDGYTVIIGHRRRAGAIAAGLDTVPCAIVEMSEGEQVSTMLLENMQRTDLTIYEQAQGIQAMMDLGETVKSISEKTGFSVSTIDRRRKLLVLDKDKFKESQSKDVSLEDYLKISEIEDDDERNKVLDSVGTHNFNWSLQNALDRQKRNKVKNIILSLLPDNVTIVTSYSSLPSWNEREEVFCISLNNLPSKEIQQELKDKIEPNVEYFVYDNNYGHLSIYKKEEKPEAPQVDAEETQAQKEEKERKEKLNALGENCAKLRKEFLENFKPTKQNADKVILFSVLTRDFDGDYGYDIEQICEKLGIAFDDDDAEFDFLEKCANENLIATLYWQAVYSLNNDGLKAHMYWNGIYDLGFELNALYKGLAVLGYEISDEEQAYIDGSHELFIQKVE